MLREDRREEKVAEGVANVHYVTGHGDDSGGKFLPPPHPSLLRSSLEPEEIRMDPASSHKQSSSAPQLLQHQLYPYTHQELQTACNSLHPETIPAGGNNPCASDQTPDESSAFVVYQLGIYGSKRFLFYTLLLFSTGIVLINSVLIIWIMSIMNISTDGIGRLRIEAELLSFGAEADVFFQKEVYANRVSAGEGSTIRFVSPQGISLSSGDSKLHLGSEAVVATAEQLVLRDESGKLQMLLDHNNRLITANRIRVNNDRALRFNCSIQAPSFTPISRHPGDRQNSKNIRVESPSRSTRLLGPKGVTVRSEKGQVAVHALRDLKLLSKSDRVIINASTVNFGELMAVFPTKRGRTYPGIMQLCLCSGTGMFFMSLPEERCFLDVSVCRPT